MRRWLSVMSVAVSILALPAVARAQAKAGDKELQIFGFVFTTITPEQRFGTITVPGDTSSRGTVFLNAGVFVSDNTEVGGGPNITISSSSPIFDTGISVFFRQYFGDQSAKIKPFAAVDYRLPSLNPSGNRSVTDSQFLEFGFGLRDYLSEKTAFDISALYGLNPRETSGPKQITVTFGLTFIF